MSWPAQNALLQLATNSKHDASAYASSDGMQSAIFGPAFWLTIHITSFNYPTNPSEQNKQDYCTWLLSIKNILPCKFCRENFHKNLQAANFSWKVMASRETFSRFCYDLHDAVNRMLNKTSPPFEEIRDRYESFRARCLSEEEKQRMLGVQDELGCVRPMHSGSKGRCTISIVPHDSSIPTFNIDGTCCPQSDKEGVAASDESVR